MNYGTKESLGEDVDDLRIETDMGLFKMVDDIVFGKPLRFATAPAPAITTTPSWGEKLAADLESLNLESPEKEPELVTLTTAPSNPVLDKHNQRVVAAHNRRIDMDIHKMAEANKAFSHYRW